MAGHLGTGGREVGASGRERGGFLAERLLQEVAR